MIHQCTWKVQKKTTFFALPVGIIPKKTYSIQLSNFEISSDKDKLKKMAFKKNSN